MRKIVTFCIATYQNYEVVKELITELLSVQSEEFDIVVSDDGSKDGSVEKLRKIDDSRLEIIENNSNAGSMLNFYAAMEGGDGEYLFYLNDRDNVDLFKIPALLCILHHFLQQDIGFAKCCKGYDDNEFYAKGNDAYLRFACHIDHPSGYIYKRDLWHSIKGRREYFENQKYGDYPFTYICAILALYCNAAVIKGNICDVYRKRIDFSKKQSRFFNKRRDKRLWYTMEKQWKELAIGYRFSKKRVKKEMLDQFFIQRYQEYLERVVLEYRYNITNPVHTLHYGVEMSHNEVFNFLNACKGGYYMWIRAVQLCKQEGNKDLIKEINKSTANVILRFIAGNLR